MESKMTKSFDAGRVYYQLYSACVCACAGYTFALCFLLHNNINLYCYLWEYSFCFICTLFFFRPNISFLFHFRSSLFLLSFLTRLLFDSSQEDSRKRRRNGRTTFIIVFIWFASRLWDFRMTFFSLPLFLIAFFRCLVSSNAEMKRNVKTENERAPRWLCNIA